MAVRDALETPGNFSWALAMVGFLACGGKRPHHQAFFAPVKLKRLAQIVAAGPKLDVFGRYESA